MLHNNLIVVILITAGITVFTRALPFLFFRNRKQPQFLKIIERDFPPMIMVLLVIYCLKDISWGIAPYGMPEIISVLIVAILHIWKGNALLSIFSGTIIYMYIVQSDILLTFL